MLLPSFLLLSLFLFHSIIIIAHSSILPCNKIQTSLSILIADARKENNFSKFAPVLQEIVDLKKEIVAVTHPQLGTVL